MDPEKQLEAAMTLLGRKETKIEELQAENKTLQAQIDALLDSQVGTDVSRVSATEIRVDGPSGLVDQLPIKYASLTRKYNDLAQQYRELNTKHQKGKLYIAEATKKYQAAKESARQWKDWVVRHTKEQQPDHAPQSNNLPSRDTTASDSHISLPTDLEHDAARVPSDDTVLERPKVPTSPAHSPPQQDHEKDISKSPRQTGPPVLRTTSSQTTEAESNAPCSSPPRREASSDNEPVVVSARPVKHRRSHSAQTMRPPVHVKQEPSTTTQPIELKSEVYSSPPARHMNLGRKQTSDLDAIVEAINTPRKTRRHQYGRHRVASEEVDRRSALAPRISSLSDSDLAEAAKDHVHVKLERCISFTSNRRQPETLVTHDNRTARQTPRSGPGDALRPISVNVPSKRLGDVMFDSSTKRRRRNENLDAKVEMLSEGGDSTRGLPPATALLNKKSDVTPKTGIDRRLHAILAEPSPNRLPLVRSHDPPPFASRPAVPAVPVPHQTTRDVIAVQSDRPAVHSRHNQPRQPAQLGAAPPPMDPADEPLRSRPLSALRLEDFKINPRYSDTGFAFADTLRGRDQRRCLQGCTRPECCGGAFRKAIEMGGGAQMSSKTDAQALEAYLGPNWSDILRAYSPDKRRDVLMQAHVQSAANLFGKHRDAFQRRSTPPGFWRTEMATTQEELDDRAQALEMEKGKIEERWRDSLREDGRWRFKDE